MTLVPHDLPDYVELSGNQVYRPPYTARETELFGFTVTANRDAIDALLQEALVEPAGNAVDYRCAHEDIMITFARIGRMGSGDPVDRDRGWMAEREVAVWCLAADAAAGHRLVWYLPYVFTDSGQTVVTGREVYGYPKQIGVFEGESEAFLRNLHIGGDTTVRALSIHPFDSEAEVRPMLSVTRQPDAGAVIGGTGWEDFEFISHAIGIYEAELQVSESLPFGPTPEPSATITSADAPPPPPTPAPRPWHRRLLDMPGGRGVIDQPHDMIANMVLSPTLVFLKQFRDVSCATKACYQAVIEAPLDVRPEGATYEQLDPLAFSIAVADWASHPIAKDLGISTPQVVRPKHAFRAEFDFNILLGQEVWRAPT